MKNDQHLRFLRIISEDLYFNRNWTNANLFFTENLQHKADKEKNWNEFIEI